MRLWTVRSDFQHIGFQPGVFNSPTSTSLVKLYIWQSKWCSDCQYFPSITFGMPLSIRIAIMFVFVWAIKFMIQVSTTRCVFRESTLDVNSWRCLSTVTLNPHQSPRFDLQWAFQPSTRILTGQGSLAIIKVAPQQSRGPFNTENAQNLRFHQIRVSTVKPAFNESNWIFNVEAAFQQSNGTFNQQTNLWKVILIPQQSKLAFNNQNCLLNAKWLNCYTFQATLSAFMDSPRIGGIGGLDLHLQTLPKRGTSVILHAQFPEHNKTVSKTHSRLPEHRKTRNKNAQQIARTM